MCSQSQGDGGTEGWEDGGMQLSLAAQSPEVLRYSPSMRSRLRGCPHPAEEDEEKPLAHSTPGEMLRAPPWQGLALTQPRHEDGERGSPTPGTRGVPAPIPASAAAARSRLCARGSFHKAVHDCVSSCTPVRVPACTAVCVPPCPWPCCAHARTSPSVRVAEEAAAAPGELLPAALLLLQLRVGSCPRPPPRCGCASLQVRGAGHDHYR